MNFGRHRSCSASGDEVDAARDQPASISEAFKVFVPLMLMAELMMISHAIIAAFLARMPDPEPVLAAYSIALYFHATLGSPVWAFPIIAISFIRDRASLRRLLAFSLQVAGGIAWLWLLVGLTPVGDWFFVELFGASPSVAQAAKHCTLISLLIIPFAIIRSLAYALIMVMRRTVLITYGTFVRLVALAALLALLTRVFEGAAVGAAALAGCIAVEGTFAALVSRRFYRALPAESREVPAFRELWSFSWPIMLMQAAENGVAFAINTVLGRLPRPELALAAFGVLDSLLRLILSPLRTLVHTTQTLVRTRSDMRVLGLFCTQIAVLFAAVMVLFYVPAVRGWVLTRVMGLPEDIAAYVAPALLLGFVLALCMAAASLMRGLLIANRRTGIIAVSSGARLGAVAVIGVIGIVLGAQNGALLGILALIAAFGVEAAVLGLRLLGLDRRSPRLFESLPATTHGD